MNELNIEFSKFENGLIPAIIQDAETGTVLMMGYMNEEAIEKTYELNKVTFFSRSKNRLWTKGEESGNFLHFVSMKNDCDKDTLLVQVNPNGPTCHKGTGNCWGDQNLSNLGFLSTLENVIENRRWDIENKSSYVKSLFDKGINKIAQKVGEEAIEILIEAKDNNDELFLNESADLLFHYLILLQAKGYRLKDVIAILKERHKA
ncbi:MAG: bifunctional phosphoribosyl-AMP cyclohydrolase/phosphoribosyl-ATP diphosphatase HisIE [Lutimonas sp.]|jgi:phosphoribosyl-AMP cyclohydrolase / phosphoribosyl-ATP pyrophosphohydrolase